MGRIAILHQELYSLSKSELWSGASGLGSPTKPIAEEQALVVRVMRLRRVGKERRPRIFGLVLTHKSPWSGWGWSPISRGPLTVRGQVTGPAPSTQVA